MSVEHNHSSNRRAQWRPGRLRWKIADMVNEAFKKMEGCESLHIDPGCIECVNGMSASLWDTPAWGCAVADGRYSSNLEILSYDTLTELAKGPIKLVESNDHNGWWVEADRSEATPDE